MTASWKWEPQSRTYGNYGNANQWTVNAGLTSLARETAQNSNDARVPEAAPELVYSFIRLTGERRSAFLDALQWEDHLLPHLEAMAGSANGAVTAGQLRSGLDAIEKSDALVLLRVADYDCYGLTGPEFPGPDVPEEEFGNLIKLCRLDLFSGKDKAAGGSFGLGKAVYWRFSRLQTVLFNSRPFGEAGGQRAIGVNAGAMHRLDGDAFQGRGYFGREGENDDIESVWDDEKFVSRLLLDRDDVRCGTSALLLGFYDPDRPDLGFDVDGLTKLAQELREGLEENFWPLLARERMSVRIEVEDDGTTVFNQTVDPSETFTELVQALHRFDNDDLDEVLDGPLTTVARDVPIKVAKRKTGDEHDTFVHQAKLVVTVSDASPDSLENRVCLFRRPEMVVETIERPFEGRTYHAFLAAGGAITPGRTTSEQLRADDFLRFAEPPSHDRWIPGRGRGQASQANLTAHYVAPWVPNLKDIEKHVVDVLFDLFGAPIPSGDKPPEAVFKHLKFLKGAAEGAASTTTAPRKPEVDIIAGHVRDGSWHVTLQVRVRNRPEGWAMEPRLAMVGLQGREIVDWSAFWVSQGPGSFDSAGRLFIPGQERGRHITVTLQGISTNRLLLPAAETAVEAVLRNLSTAETENDLPADVLKAVL